MHDCIDGVVVVSGYEDRSTCETVSQAFLEGNHLSDGVLELRDITRRCYFVLNRDACTEGIRGVIPQFPDQTSDTDQPGVPSSAYSESIQGSLKGQFGCTLLLTKIFLASKSNTPRWFCVL